MRNTNGKADEVSMHVTLNLSVHPAYTETVWTLQL